MTPFIYVCITPLVKLTVNLNLNKNINISKICMFVVASVKWKKNIEALAGLVNGLL